MKGLGRAEDPAPPLVIDASVAIPLVLEERLSRSARRLVRIWRGRRMELIAPSFLWIEVANVLVRYLPNPAAVAEALHYLDRAGIRTAPVDRPLLLLAIQHAHASRLTIYDALYLALAEVEDARLATADRALAEAAGPRAILLGEEDGAIHETSAEYGSGAADYGAGAVDSGAGPSPDRDASPPAGPDAWPGMEAYLDRLRGEVAAPRR